MAQQTINIGSTPNDGTGDPLRTAMQKTNSNFTELYAEDAALDGRLDTAETNITTLDGRIDANDTTIADHETRIDGAETDIGVIQSDITSLTATVLDQGNDLAREASDLRGIHSISASTTYDGAWLGQTLNVDASGGAVTVTLPTDFDTGQIVRIRKSDATTTPVIVTPFGTTFANLNSQHEYIEAYWNGTAWLPLKWNDMPYGSNLDGRVTTLESTVIDPTVVALAGLNSTAGLVEQTGTDAFTKRLIGIANSTDIPTRADADTRYAQITYVDGLVQGLDVKASVRAATTADFANTSPTATVLTASANGALTVDGIAMADNDRLLVKNQTLPAENGIYIVTDAGDGSNPAVLTRAADMNAWAEFPGAFVFVEEGTANANAGWTCTVDAGGTLGTTSVTFTQFSGAGTYTANGGVTLSGVNFALTDMAQATIKGRAAGAGTGAPTDLTAAQVKTVLDLKQGDVGTDFTSDSTTAYTLVLTDAGKHVMLDNASAIALTVPDNATVAFPIGTKITVEQSGAGAITVGGAGVTFHSLGSDLTTAGQYAVITLLKKATNIWLVYGGL